MRFSLGIRKLVVLILLGSILLLANVWFVVGWLDERGFVEGAKYLKSEYLTGTAITIIVTLIILLVKPGKEVVSHTNFGRRCSVCDRILLSTGKYCSECGSKVGT